MAQLSEAEVAAIRIKADERRVDGPSIMDPTWLLLARFDIITLCDAWEAQQREIGRLWEALTDRNAARTRLAAVEVALRRIVDALNEPAVPMLLVAAEHGVYEAVYEAKDAAEALLGEES